MLDRLPTELLLVIAELAAPRTAQDRQCLFINRRLWFAQLASISRFFWYRLRPLVWTEVWIHEGTVSALASAIEEDPSTATFTKRLVCSRISANTFERLGRIFPYFSNVKSMEIRASGSAAAPLRLSAIESLALKHLTLTKCDVEQRLPRLQQLEALCMCSYHTGHAILPPSDPHIAAPTQIITDLSSASNRSLRLLLQCHTSSFRHPNRPQADFANLTLLELDTISFGTIRRLEDVFPSLPCRVVLRCEINELLGSTLGSHPRVSARPLPAKFEIWVRSDARPGSRRQLPLEHLQAVVRVAPHLSTLTLPLNLGIGRESDEIAQARSLIYEVLKHFVRTKISIHFHNEPRDTDEYILDPDFKTLDEFDGGGYFSDLVAGKVDDPELRDFRVVVV